jgi:hypothetical protein
LSKYGQPLSSIKTILFVKLSELDKSSHAFIGFDKIKLPSSLLSGLSFKFGPKAACLNSIGLVPLGEMTSIVFLLVEKTGSLLNLPPTSALVQVIPPS